jgi:hypothetical protein
MPISLGFELVIVAHPTALAVKKFFFKLEEKMPGRNAINGYRPDINARWRAAQECDAPSITQIRKI